MHARAPHLEDAPGGDPPRTGGARGCAPAQEGAKATHLYVHIETRQALIYAGDPHEVTILFKNNGKDAWTNPGMEIEAGFQVYGADGKKLERAATVTSLKDGQPKVLEPNGYFGKIVDLNTLFPKMAALGTYKITWSGPGISEKTINSRVIKKYDPAREYQAVIDTEFGPIVMDFYRDLAPLHVKNFIDLANQGVNRGQSGFVTILEAVHPEKVDVRPEEMVE